MDKRDPDQLSQVARTSVRYQPQDPALLGPREEHPDQGLPAASHKLQGSPAMGSRSGSPIFTWARVLARVSLGS